MKRSAYVFASLTLAMSAYLFGFRSQWQPSDKFGLALSAFILITVTTVCAQAAYNGGLIAPRKIPWANFWESFRTDAPLFVPTIVATASMGIGFSSPRDAMLPFILIVGASSALAAQLTIRFAKGVTP